MKGKGGLGHTPDYREVAHRPSALDVPGKGCPPRGRTRTVTACSTAVDSRWRRETSSSNATGGARDSDLAGGEAGEGVAAQAEDVRQLVQPNRASADPTITVSAWGGMHNR
jgi:hypothetical protein